MNERFLVATDLDGTVLGDPESEKNFFRWGLERKKEVVLAYVTGRNIDNVLTLIESETLPSPDFIAGAVGTRMLDMRHSGEDLGADFLNQAPTDFPLAKILKAGGEMGFQLQPDGDMNSHKASFYWDGDLKRLEALRQKASQISDIHLVATAGIYVDILPAAFGKGRAIKFLADRLDLGMDRVLVAGDSEHDLEMFEWGSHGVLPANAAESLRSRVRGERVVRSPHKYARALLEVLKQKGLA